MIEKADQQPFEEILKDQESRGVHVIRNPKYVPSDRVTVGSLYGKSHKQILEESERGK